MSRSSLTFQLPIPDKCLSPNARTHRAVRWKAVKAARTAARKEAGRVLKDAQMDPPRWAKVRIQAAVFLSGRMKETDPDNLIASLKAYQDGLADAGIIANDKGAWPERPTFQRVERMPRVEITVTSED